jgi:hypothetical protein
MPATATIATVGATFGGKPVAVKVHRSLSAFTRAAADFYIVDKV